MNPIYELTDHAHSEEELAPWLDACGTGRETIDGLLLTALDWRSAPKPPEPTQAAHARQGTAPVPGTTDPPLRFEASPTTDHAPPCPVRRGRETERRTSAPPPKAFPCGRLAKAFGS